MPSPEHAKVRRVELHIAGEWGPAEDDATYVCTSPVDGTRYAELADAATTDVDRAVTAAAAAFYDHSRRSTWERAELCARIADEFTARREDIAHAVTRETGRTYRGCLDEVRKAAQGFRLAGEEVKRLAGESIPVEDPSKTVFTQWHGTGVWAVITPFNFPVNIPVEYLGPAVAAGNTVVWKPSPTASVSAAVMVECMIAAGLPAGVVNLITTAQIPPAERLVEHPDVVGVALTGSTPTGHAVAKAAGGKQLILELGGNGPIMVFDDADLDRAAPAIALSCFMASGQLCSAGGRILTEASVADDLADRLVALVGEYPTGDPYDPATVMGPLHTPQLSRHVADQVDDACQRGSRLLAGGAPLLGFATEQYFPATVLTDVPVDARINDHETFGPVAPVIPLPADKIFDEANRGDHALSAAIFTANIDRAFAAANDLNFGAVVINDRSSYWELHLPYGGWRGKASGQGRVGVSAVLRQMSQTKVVSVSRAIGLRR